MPKTITNKTTRADRIRKIKAGLQKYYATTPLVIAGTTYQPAALQSSLQGDIDANDTSTQAKAAWMVTVKAAQQADASVAPLLRGIRSQVMAQFGEAPNADSVLADFGYAPRKKVTKSVQTKAEAIAKSQATRTARGTKGPKAKAKIHGTVPVAGAAADAQPVVSTTPAPVVSSNPASASSQGAPPSGSTSKSSP